MHRRISGLFLQHTKCDWSTRATVRFCKAITHRLYSSISRKRTRNTNKKIGSVLSFQFSFVLKEILFLSQPSLARKWIEHFSIHKAMNDFYDIVSGITGKVSVFKLSHSQNDDFIRALSSRLSAIAKNHHFNFNSIRLSVAIYWNLITDEILAALLIICFHKYSWHFVLFNGID